MSCYYCNYETVKILDLPDQKVEVHLCTGCSSKTYSFGRLITIGRMKEFKYIEEQLAGMCYEKECWLQLEED